MSDISWYSWTLERHIEKGTNPVEVSSPRNAIDSHPTPVGGPPIKARFVVSITYSCNQVEDHLQRSPRQESAGSATPEKASFAEAPLLSRQIDAHSPGPCSRYMQSRIL